MQKEPEDRLSAQEAIYDPWICQQGVPEIDLFAQEDCFENMQSFYAEYKMQEAVITYIVQQLIGSNETEDQKKIFTQLDDDNDGQLTREELLKGYREFYGDLAE